MAPVGSVPRGARAAQALASGETDREPEKVAPAHHFVRAYVAGGLAGFAGRLVTNNATQSLANIQDGRSKFDLSGRTAISLGLGSAIQTGVTYAARHYLNGPAEETFGRPGRIASDVAAGALGGMAMHPACVRFLLKDELAKDPAVARSRFPAFRGTWALLEKQPRVFMRGLGARVALSGIDWGVYFAARESLRSSLSERRAGAADSLAAVGAIVASTPFYRIYVHQIRTGASFLEAGRRLFAQGAPESPAPAAAGRAVSPRLGPKALTGLFVLVSVVEKVVVDRTHFALEAASAKLGGALPSGEAEPYGNVELR